MNIQSVQKVIKVGSSLAVTIPARDAKALGIRAGDDVLSSHQLLKPTADTGMERIDADYEAFKREYHQTLQNLASR
jgi:antitoxin component of MazEF toxin-antitoxin module